jgi:hypothetical protein
MEPLRTPCEPVRLSLWTAVPASGAVRAKFPPPVDQRAAVNSVRAAPPEPSDRNTHTRAELPPPMGHGATTCIEQRSEDLEGIKLKVREKGTQKRRKRSHHSQRHDSRGTRAYTPVHNSTCGLWDPLYYSLHFWWCWRALSAAIAFLGIVSLCRPPPHQDRGRAKAAGNRFALADKVPGPQLGANNYPKNGLVNPPRRNTRALSPAGMFGEKAPPRSAAQKSRPHAHLGPMRCAPAYFLCKLGV